MHPRPGDRLHLLPAGGAAGGGAPAVFHCNQNSLQPDHQAPTTQSGQQCFLQYRPAVLTAATGRWITRSACTATRAGPPTPAPPPCRWSSGESAIPSSSPSASPAQALVNRLIHCKSVSRFLIWKSVYCLGWNVARGRVRVRQLRPPLLQGGDPADLRQPAHRLARQPACPGPSLQQLFKQYQPTLHNQGLGLIRLYSIFSDFFKLFSKS